MHLLELIFTSAGAILFFLIGCSTCISCIGFKYQRMLEAKREQQIQEKYDQSSSQESNTLQTLDVRNL